MTLEELLEKYATGVLDFRGIELAEANLSGIKLSGANLSRANLSVVNLSGANLSEANLSYSQLNVARLSGANLADAILNYSSLNVANLIRADLSRAQLRAASLVRTELIRANLSRADLLEANLSSADLREASLRQANLRRSNLNEANLRGCFLTEANLEMANLNGADISYSDLSGVNLRDSELKQANLAMSNLSGADLSGANLRWADLRGANLRWADLSGAKLSGANLAGADLSHANLTNASLVHANLTQTNLMKVEWMGADLTAAMLTGAKLYATLRFGLKTEGINCEWVDLSPDGDRSMIQQFNGEDAKDFFNATPPTVRIVVDAPLDHEANLALAGTYYHIAQEYQLLKQPPSVESGSRRTVFTFRLDSDIALLPTAYMAILAFRDATATQRNIYAMVELIQREVTDQQNLISPHLSQKLILLIEEITSKVHVIKQKNKYLATAVKLNFFQSPTQTILTNSRAQTLIVYDHPYFGKKIIDRPALTGYKYQDHPNDLAYTIPSLNLIVDFVKGFYYDS
ncbi:MAG TPA: pentapeptide repeat-containing protein [Nostocaceae cyanobacterium]|nr:pentapeptide repeat-containing protein [Nostocaceae cyanobacterium]